MVTGMVTQRIIDPPTKLWPFLRNDTSADQRFEQTELFCSAFTPGQGSHRFPSWCYCIAPKRPGMHSSTQEPIYRVPCKYAVWTILYFVSP